MLLCTIANLYGVPHIHEAPLRREVDRLCQTGVLTKQNDSEWAAGAFIIPKTNGTVRFISKLRELNKRIVRKPSPISKIQIPDSTPEAPRLPSATSLDFNMGYFTVRLDSDARKS